MAFGVCQHSDSYGSAAWSLALQNRQLWNPCRQPRWSPAQKPGQGIGLLLQNKQLRQTPAGSHNSIWSLPAQHLNQGFGAAGANLTASKHPAGSCDVECYAPAQQPSQGELLLWGCCCLPDSPQTLLQATVMGVGLCQHSSKERGLIMAAQSIQVPAAQAQAACSQNESSDEGADPLTHHRTQRLAAALCRQIVRPAVSIMWSCVL